MIKKIKEIAKKITIERLVFVITMISLIGVPVIIGYRYTSICMGVTPIHFDRAYMLWLGVPSLIALYILDIVINKKKVTYFDIMIYLLILLAIISTIFAVSVKTSIFGARTRNEGLLSLLSYYFILLNYKNMTNEKLKKIILRTIIGIGVASIIYGLFQVFTTSSLIIHFPQPYMASGLIGNANFFGSYMVIVSSFGFAMYLLERKKKYLILTIVFFIGVCLSGSTGPFLGFSLMALFFMIFYRKRIKWKNVLIILLLLVTTYFTVDYTVKYVHINIFGHQINTKNNISSDLANLNLSDLGSGRLNLWKHSLPLVEKYWALGTGLDNFGFVNDFRIDGLHVDKAHNVYLQILITNGVFAFIIYMVLMAIIFFKGLKIKNTFYVSLLMAFVGYCIQAFTNISVIEVAPAFFLICGLLIGQIEKGRMIQ